MALIYSQHMRSVTLLCAIILFSACTSPKREPPPVKELSQAGNKQQLVCNTRFFTSSVCVTIVWESQPAIGVSNKLTLLFWNPNTPDILLDPQYPMQLSLMDKATQNPIPPPILNKISVGTYKATEILLPSRGEWDLHISLFSHNTIIDEAIYSFRF